MRRLNDGVKAAGAVLGHYGRERGWATYSMASGVVTLVAFFLMALGINQTEGFVEFAGLYQRMSIVAGFGCLTLLAIKFLGSSAPRR